MGTVADVSPDSELTPRNCSVTDATNVLGDQYSIPIVRELLYGNRRFSDLAAMTGAPRSLLSGRLRRLEAAGVVERRQYNEHPPRDTYHLTDAGRSLLPVLIAFKEWGDRHCRDGIQSATFQHACGAELHTATVCGSCRQPVAFDDLTVVGGSHPPVIHAGD